MLACRIAPVAVLFVTLCVPIVRQRGAASEIPYWPSEQAERLKKLDPQMLRVQGKLFGARLRKDGRAAKRLRKELRVLEEERIQLLRAMRQLPE